MPTYQYRCTSCDTDLEVVQKFTDDPLSDCPDCDGNLRKVFNAVGVVFKGSGFYATDNRSKPKSGAPKSTDAPKPADKPAASSKGASAPGAAASSSTGTSSAA
jgi:putative FmdB family regulatory protein